jgi:hypothetical protein
MPSTSTRADQDADELLLQAERADDFLALQDLVLERQQHAEARRQESEHQHRQRRAAEDPEPAPPGHGHGVDLARVRLVQHAELLGGPDRRRREEGRPRQRGEERDEVELKHELPSPPRRCGSSTGFSEAEAGSPLARE